MTLQVTVVATPEEKKLALALRYRVFIDEQGYDGALEVDEHDDEATTMHFIGRDVEQDKVVAVARCLIDSASRKAKIGRVAVLAECRGKSYGTVLMAAVEDAVRGRVDSFALSAQFDKRAFYEKCGYQRINDETHLDEGVPHCWMSKTVAA